MDENRALEPADQTGAPLASGQSGRAEGAGQAQGGTDGISTPLFTLNFRIPVDAFIAFNKIMGADAVKKKRRNTVLLGWVEFLFGVAFLVTQITTQAEAGLFYYFIIALMILVGLYSILYYRYFYESSMAKVMAKQHAETPYLQSEIVVDFYRNRLAEHVGEKSQETFWHTISDIKVTPALYMVMLESKRCLLIPRDQLGVSQDGALDQLLREVCVNYEKPRYEL